MKRSATTVLSLLVVLFLTAAVAAPVSAALRVPQKPVLGGTLQGYLNSVGEAINVLTDQDVTQAWARTSSNTTAYTIQFQNSPNTALHTISMYNSTAGPAPALYFIMSGAVGPLGFSTATFKPGNVLTVNRFDALANFLSTTTYNGVDPNGFGFALNGPGGLHYTQDARNAGGAAQALAYRGTGANAGTWWLCWEESSVAAGSDQDFDDEVILMESVNPTPVNKTSWGQLKTRFR